MQFNFYFHTVVAWHHDITNFFFIYQLMHKRVALKRILKFTLQQLRHISMQSPSSGSVLIELPKVIGKAVPLQTHHQAIG